MGDPLSVTASIIAVLQLTSEVIEFCLDLANAPKAILSLKEEVESLQLLLKQLKERCEKTLHDQKTPPPWLQGQLTDNKIQIFRTAHRIFVAIVCFACASQDGL